ncbi:MAG: thiamine phosphate synthase [Propionibacteriaceae bacterium]
MAKLDLSVYLVTDTAKCGGVDGVVETVRQAVAAGCTLVQLRDSTLSDADFVALGRRVKQVCGEVPLLIDDRVHLVAESGADGVHVGQSDLPVDQARLILGSDAIVGLTANTPAEVAHAIERYGIEAIDYLGAGALHATSSKDGVTPVGLAGVERIIDVSPWPVCAIGGVTAADAGPLANSGCSGMSVISAICGQPDVSRATRALVEAWQEATR